MSDAVSVDTQGPAGPAAPRMLRRWFDYAGGKDVVAIAVVVGVLIEGCNHHSGSEVDELTGFGPARVLMRETEEIRFEKTVEVGENPGRFVQRVPPPNVKAQPRGAASRRRIGWSALLG